MERLSRLRTFLVQELRNVIGDSLGNPGLYQKTLCDLQETYGNPRAVAAACSTNLKSLPSFKDGDPIALRKFSMLLRSIVSTLEVGGYGGELYVNSTLQSLEEKLPPILCDKWADFSSRITGHLPNISDFNEWAKQETKILRSNDFVDVSGWKAQRAEEQQRRDETVQVRRRRTEYDNDGHS